MLSDVLIQLKSYGCLRTVLLQAAHNNYYAYCIIYVETCRFSLHRCILCTRYKYHWTVAIELAGSVKSFQNAGNQFTQPRGSCLLIHCSIYHYTLPIHTIARDLCQHPLHCVIGLHLQKQSEVLELIYSLMIVLCFVSILS